MERSTLPPSASGGDDDRIITCGDATLIRSDLSVLRGPHFLNDRLIHFYFSHLSESSCDDRILLVPPSISYLISNFSDPISLSDVIAPLRLRQKDIVLFPVNDNPDVTVAEGGSHWSLLLCHVPVREFVHHDSNGGMNKTHAFKLFKAAKNLIDGHVWRYMEGPTPQQTNGYDCGLFVLAIARVICEWYYRDNNINDNNNDNNNNKEKWFGMLMEEVNGNKVQELRAELLSFILELTEKGNALVSKSTK